MHDLPSHEVALLLDEAAGVMVEVANIVFIPGLMPEDMHKVRYGHLLTCTTLKKMHVSSWIQ